MLGILLSQLERCVGVTSVCCITVPDLWEAVRNRKVVTRSTKDLGFLVLHSIINFHFQKGRFCLGFEISSVG